MDFAMKDFEAVALHSTKTAAAATAGDAVNVQYKKSFDIADVDNNEMKLENDDWNIDTIFPLNNDFLNEFNDLADINMDANWADAYDYMSSPTTSTGTESENDHDMLGMKPISNQMLSPPQNLISSSSSDSGLSSDHVDFDMNFDPLSSELLQQQPLLSSQIIPDFTDDNLLIRKKSIKSEPIGEKIATTTISAAPSQQNVYKVIPSNASKSIPMKTTLLNSNVSPQKVQIVKKITPNVVHQISDSKSSNIATNSPIVINKVNGNISGIRKVIQVKKGPNQKSIILPFSLKNGTDIRSIKIIKPSSLTKSPKILMAASNLLQEYKQNTIIVNKPVKLEPKYENDSTSEPSDCESYKFEEMFVQDDDDDDDDDEAHNESEHEAETEHQSEYPKLILSGEEKRLLAKEGITLPAHYPLTKHEERELKRIRRKIRNKISAQDSRKRKKEYVDGLEERVKKCTDENQTLLKRIKLLQSQNQNLINQMKKMQSLLTKGGNKSVQPATCLMVLLMSMALIAAPNLKLNKENNTDIMPSDIMMEENQMQQNRRTLLFDSREKFGDMVADEEIGTDFNLFSAKSETNEHNYADSSMPPSDVTSAQPIDDKIGILIDTLDVDDSIWVPPKNATHKIMPQTTDGIAASPNILQNDAKMIEYNRIDDDTIKRAAATATKVMHMNSAKNRSHLPSETTYQLNLEANGIPNIILNTEIDV